MAGELGHFTVYADGHPCGCGSRGCLEQYASATAVVRMASEAIARGEARRNWSASRMIRSQFTSRSIYNLAIQGEVRCEEGVRECGTRLGNRHRRDGERTESTYLRNRWRRFQRLGRFRSRDVRRDEVPLLDLRADFAGRIGHEKDTIVTRALIGSDAGLYGAARLPMLENFSQTEKGRR